MSDGPSVGVVGTRTGPVVTAVEAAGGVATVGPARTVVEDSEYVVAVDEAPLLATVRASPTVPVLPVEAGRGVRSVPMEAVSDAIDFLFDGDYECDSHPVSDVTVVGVTRSQVLFDAMLVTEQAADISEYAVHAGEQRVARFRADGVVVATPAGSSGYTARAGGPVVSPETGVVVVVPIAPFATHIDHWVLPSDDVRLSVERDESSVHLVADDRVVGQVGPGDPVRMDPTTTVDVAVVPASESSFE